MKWGTVCNGSWAAAWVLEWETDFVITYSTKWPQQVAHLKEVITSGKTFVGNHYGESSCCHCDIFTVALCINK